MVAVDGQQRVAMAADEKPDLILMDMSLPIMDGWEATRRIKADPSTNAIPVIALTAHALVQDREKAFAAGCDDFDTRRSKASWRRSRNRTLPFSDRPRA